MSKSLKKFKIEYNGPVDGGVCPPGLHFVRAHERQCHSGKIIWVDAHFSRDPKKKDHPAPLLVENLYYLFTKANSKSPKIGTINGFPEYEEIDPLIDFWVNYWRSRGLKFPNKLNLKVIKALIAYESSFNPNAKASSSTALGLMQITNTTRQIVGGAPNEFGFIEVSKEQIHVKQEDLKDPLVNIAVGIRWLAYKFQKIPKKHTKNTFNMLKHYNEWSKKGEEYAKKVIKLSEGNSSK